MDYRKLFCFDGLTIVHGYGSFLDAEPDTVFNFNGYGGILDFYNPAVNTADGDYFLTLLQTFLEFFLIFRPLHLRTDKEEIENYDDKYQRKK